MKPTIHETPCPHPDCQHVLRVSDTTQAGTYLCDCKASTVKLGWATYQQGGRKPYLSLAEKEGKS